MSTHLATIQPREMSVVEPSVHMGFFNVASFELMQRVAKAFASSTLVPKDYQGNIANMMIVLNMAQRMNADPLMIAQSLNIIHGRPGWSAQYLIATFNSCGRYGSIRYRWQGEEGKDTWACQAYATEKASGNEIKSAWVSIAMAKKEGWYSKSGSKWQTMPEQMMMYRSASFLIRTHAPELSMGLSTTDDLIDDEPRNITPVSDLNARLATETVKTAELPEPAASYEWPKADANGELLDIRGCPWLESVHSVNRTCSTDGTWRRKRGTDPDGVRVAEDNAIAARQQSASVVEDAPPFELTGELTDLEKGMAMAHDAKTDDELDGIIDWSRDADLSDDDRTRLYCAIDEKRAV